MTHRSARRAGTVVVTALALAAAACTGEGYQTKEFTAKKSCRSCEGGGLFSGDDGRFTILGGKQRGADDDAAE